MKIILFLITLLIPIFCLESNSLAAPAPTLFVYNDATRQCGTYRDGDEFVRYDLPQQWQTYDYQKSIANTTQTYCDELGYTNIGSVVSYLNLKPIILRDRTDLTSVSKKQINYKAIIVFTTLALVILLALTLTIHKIYKTSKKH